MKRLWPAALLLCAFALFLAWPVGPEDLDSRGPRGQVPHLGSDEPALQAAELRRALRSQFVDVEVELLFVDREGSPVAGVALDSENGEVVSDAEGRLRLEGLSWGTPVHLDVRAPWRMVSWTGTVFGDSTWTVVVERLCPGLVRVVDASGEGVPGRRVGLGGWGETDQAGELWLDERPCGWQELSIDSARRRVEVRGGEALEAVLEGPFRGLVQAVDPRGEPVDVTLLAPRAELERLGPGLYEVESWLARPYLKWDEERGGRVLLDGSVAELVVPEDRSVRVEVVGETPVLQCDRLECADLGDGAWDCPCGPGTSRLTFGQRSLSNYAHFRLVPPEVEELRLDLRTATVRGRWAGRLPCEVSAFVDGLLEAGVECDADGSFELQTLVGDTTISVAGSGQSATSRVLLGPDEDVDLGELGPGTAVLEGQLQPDFELRSPVLWVFPAGEGQVDDAGRVRVSGVGDSGQVWLVLNAGQTGQFQATFAVEDGPFTWALSAQQAGPWSDPEPSAEPLDTGFSWDTGRWTGLDSADSGWQDSGGG